MPLFGNRFVSWIGVAGLLVVTPAHADEGLPQFDTNLFPEQLFWLAITFGILYVLMAFVALPRVTQTKDNRRNIIATELAAAEIASFEAKAAAAAVEKALAEARAKANAHVSEMLADLSNEMTARQAEQEKEIKRQLRRTEADIAVVREAALKKIQDSAAELAASIIETVTGSKMRGQA